MFYKILQKYVCCSLDLTIATRIIGFMGIMISILLITVLLNDKYNDEQENYDISRKTALALGLDWQHFHPKASTAYHNDLEGKKITVIVVFYSFVFLLINLLLCFATIRSDWRFTVPWLICEFFGWLSKFGALIYHLCSVQDNLSNIFLIGSLFYIVTIMWWWAVVLLAQFSWRHKKDLELNLELSTLPSCAQTSQETDVIFEKIHYFPDSVKDTSTINSPVPYIPNVMYALI